MILVFFIKNKWKAMKYNQLQKGWRGFGISGSKRKNQKITSSNGEKGPLPQSGNYDVSDIDEMLIIS